MSPSTAAKMARQGNKHIDRLIKKAMDKLSHGESNAGSYMAIKETGREQSQNTSSLRIHIYQ